MPSDPVTPERWPDDVRLMVNAEPEDGRGDYDIWHTGGPGGPWLTAISKEAAMSVIAVVDEVHALRAALAERDEDYRRVVSEACAGDEKHCACVPHLRRRIRELEERVSALLADDLQEARETGWVHG